MTTRLSIFSSPFLLGFEQCERSLERITKGDGGYPPYNIEQTSENSLRITLAVAGFSSADLSVQVEDNQLVVRGKQSCEKERNYIHRGIASRAFQRGFVLAEGIEIGAANLDNGLLHIELSRKVAEPRVQNIPINSGAKAQNAHPIEVGKK